MFGPGYPPPTPSWQAAGAAKLAVLTLPCGRVEHRFSRLTNGCAWNAVSAFANCGRAVAHVRGSYVPGRDSAPHARPQCPGAEAVLRGPAASACLAVHRSEHGIITRDLISLVWPAPSVAAAAAHAG